MNNAAEELRLSPRLKKIAELIPPTNSIADIGTDHAYIPIYALLNGISPRAVASDIKLGPVARAAENIERFGLKSQISVRLGPGLSTISSGEAEVIVIAGMGGLLIADILDAARDIAKAAKLLILQPMTATPELRAYLAENRFSVKTEHLVAEEEKIYNIIEVQGDGSSSYTEKELILGKDIDKTSPELYDEYASRLVKKYTTRLEGLRISRLPENIEKALEIERILKLLTSPR